MTGLNMDPVLRGMMMHPNVTKQSKEEILEDIEDRMHHGWRLEADIEWLIHNVKDYFKYLSEVSLPKE